MSESNHYDEDVAKRIVSTYAKQIDDLECAAEAYCALVDGLAQTTPVAFLTSLEPVLVHLYAKFVAFPSGDLLFEDGDEDENTDVEDASLERVPLAPSPQVRAAARQELAINHEIRALLGKYDAYRDGFDPYEGDGEYAGTLGDDLASIYVLLKTNVRLCTSDDMQAAAEGLWNLSWDFDHHCGRHLLNALTATYFLLRFRRPAWDDDAWEAGYIEPYKVTDDDQFAST